MTDYRKAYDQLRMYLTTISQEVSLEIDAIKSKNQMSFDEAMLLYYLKGKIDIVHRLTEEANKLISQD